MANILIIANFSNGKNLLGRFTYLADMLTSEGHEVELITSDFNHALKKFKDTQPNTLPFKVTMVHEPGYPDNISLKRIYSHYVWGRNVKKYLQNSSKKWDIIYCAVPSLTATRFAGKYAKRNNIKFITDIQDLWPEAFAVAIRNKIIRKIGFIPMHIYANAGYKYADKVIGVSDTYRDRGLLPCKETTPCLTVYLGNDGNMFDNAKANYKTNKPENEFWIAYIGTLGYSYDLKCIIDAISLFNRKHTAPTVRFIVMGEGPRREEFEEYANSKGIQTKFTGSLPYQEMVGRLCTCDAVVNPIVKGGAQSITNKVGDYALSGLPVINTQECEEYRQLLEKYHCGINCDVGNAEEVAEAIEYLLENPKIRKEMGENSRKLGVERFDRNNTYQNLINFIIN